MVWGALAAPGDYPTWWPWLLDFDGTSLTGGVTWRCAVRSPLGIQLRFEIQLDAVDPYRSVDATVVGDLHGTATLNIEAAEDGGTVLELTSSLEPRVRSLGRLMRRVPRIARWAHDRLLDTGARQFGEALPVSRSRTGG